MSDRLQIKFIQRELENFVKSPRCCRQFSASFGLNDMIIKEAQKLKLKAIPSIQDGLHLTKVFKLACSHRPTMVVVQELTKPVLRQDSSNSCRDPDVLPVCSTRTPAMAVYRLRIGLHKESKLHHNVELLPHMDPYTVDILQALKRSRVLVVNGRTTFEKSIMLPLCIMKDLSMSKSNCKIICVEREALLATHYCQRMAQHFNEHVGTTITCRVHLQSRVCPTSNLVYTTASFLIRQLMGQHMVERFRHISHIIIDEVHLHESYTDILLGEIRNTFLVRPGLRVILLANSGDNAELLKFFGEGEELRIGPPFCEQAETPERVLLVNTVRKMVKERFGENQNQKYLLPLNTGSPHQQNDYVDRCLLEYERTGSQQAFEAFLYMVKTEYASINYRQSESGRTAAIIASRLGNAAHLRILLELRADPFITDAQSVNVIFGAVQGGNAECRSLRYDSSNRTTKDCDPNYLDFDLIMGVVRALLTSANWSAGNILIFMPNYEALMHLYFGILRFKLIGDLAVDLNIHVLHADMEEEAVNTLLAASNESAVILSTEIGESFSDLPRIVHVIDTMRTQRVVYNADAQCNAEKTVWISKESARRRCQLLQATGVCFRLITWEQWEHLPTVHTPELLEMPLDRICLTVKLVAPSKLFAEYMQNCIITPPLLHLYNAVQRLQSMEALDEMENVTWLGCRLIDLPVDCQLGKLLIYGILLRCLNPILTIVSCLAYRDPLALPADIDVPPQPGSRESFAALIRQKIKQERKKLVESVPSDHFMYLRLYQAWQNAQQDESLFGALTDEHHFVRNCIMDRVSVTRTQLMTALQCAYFIHPNGQLNMNNVNINSSSWPLVKAALVGGLHPNICFLDRESGRIRSRFERELMLHPSSVLRTLMPQPMAVYAEKLNSSFLVFTRTLDGVCCNSIDCCTSIAPIVVALFGGTSKGDLSKLIQPMEDEAKNVCGQTSVMLQIDNNLVLDIHMSVAQIVLQTRQYFYDFYSNYLQNCCDLDVFERNNQRSGYLLKLFSSLRRLLHEADEKLAFTRPGKVGMRPTSTYPGYLARLHSRSAAEFRLAAYNKMPIVGMSRQMTTEKLYFTAYIPEKSADDCQSRKDLTQFVRANTNLTHQTYVILYNKRYFYLVGLLTATDHLHECFINLVPILELLHICYRYKLPLPPFNERRIACKVNPRIGRIILHLFAYRNNILHNN